MKDPGLALEICRIVDYSGRTIEGTLLGLALGAEDVKFHENEECMAEMIMRHLRTFPEGEDIINAQILKQFPPGWEIAEEERVKNDSAALHRLI